MQSNERNFNFHGEFQPVPGYRDIARAPHVVVQQTNALLGLFKQSTIDDTTPAVDYLINYTIPYLSAAERGQKEPSQDIEAREAAGFTFVIFAWMHFYGESKYLTMGFSRKGMLRAPGTTEEYFTRLRELRLELFKMTQSRTKSYSFPESDPSLLRTLTFFEVGSRLPLKFPESEREKFNRLLADLSIPLE